MRILLLLLLMLRLVFLVWCHRLSPLPGVALPALASTVRVRCCGGAGPSAGIPEARALNVLIV